MDDEIMTQGLKDSFASKEIFSERFLRQTSCMGIISQSPLMHRVFQTINKVSKSNATVLVLGESGTGKELVARAIHKMSCRTGKLVPVNCGAIPEEILESELFGHEKGSFTGAIANRIGRFQMAEGGTIFLDEIGEMSPKLQVKLLRVLQERVVEPVGSTRSYQIDVRVIAATNKNLAEEVKAGRFREDLFYRLQVVPMELPALREREGDVKLLAEHFLNKFIEANQLGTLTFSQEAISVLSTYSWPGNIRELENLVERLAILAESDEILANDLPEYVLNPERRDARALSLQGRSSGTTSGTLPSAPAIDFALDGKIDFNGLVSDFENTLIQAALTKTGGNKKAAAELLNLNRTTLVEKIKKKGLESQIEVICEAGSDAADGALDLDYIARNSSATVAI